MGLFLKVTQAKRYLSIALLLLLTFIMFFLGTAIIIRSIFISQIKTSLAKLTNRIQNDLKYENGKWDTTLYNADPQTPHPTGSSGFVTPLYIVTTDGFVIERNQTISGLLDTSDYKRLLAFSNPQTINAITNESWRILSKPLVKNSTTYGVAMVSYFNPIPNSQAEIDQKLKRNLDTLTSQIAFSNNAIDISKMDIRDLDYDVSFEVVDTFNKVLANNGRNPSFIDPSYVDATIKSQPEEIISDTFSREKFLIIRKILFDSKNIPRAVVIAGESIDFIDNGLYHYIPYAFIMTLIGTALGILFITNTFNIQNLLKHASTHQISPLSIEFNSKDGLLNIDKEKIEIPLNSHQYKILNALFSEPAKVWKQEELLSHFHESGNQENSRKIYDAMLAINKKVPFKLIAYKEKTYSIEPSLLPLLTSK